MNVEEIRKKYDDLITNDSRVDLKGKTMHYTSLNGNMFSFVSKDGEVGFRLSKSDQEDYIANHNAEVMMQHGRVMRDYVKVSLGFIANASLMEDILSKSIQFSATLKAKPTTKKKK